MKNKITGLVILMLAICHNSFAAVSEDKPPLQTPPPLSATSAQTLTQPAAPAPSAATPAVSASAQAAAAAYSAGDLAKARQIWEQLANAGDAQAMNNLGVLYDQGNGVEPDTGRALYWFSMAANNGNASGMNNYGRMLEQGRGIPENATEAARWFDAAARLGQPEAQYNIGFLYENGRGVPRDDNAAAAWYSRAASLKQTDALARLGHFYRVGKGVQPDLARATLLLYAAAMDGSAQAIKELEELAREIPPKAQAVLFGQKLDETRRASMREALHKAGAAIRREDDEHICDVYDAAKIAPGASEMAICYGPGGRLGFLKTDYPTEDKARAEAVLKMVESRFGPATSGEGEDARLWNLGSVIVATQYAPAHRQMSLMYMVPEVYHQTRNDSASGK